MATDWFSEQVGDSWTKYLSDPMIGQGRENVGTPQEHVDYFDWEKRFGIKNPFKMMGSEITELRRVASEGLDPLQFRRSGEAGLIGIGRSQIAGTGETLSGMAGMVGNEVRSGAESKVQAGGFATRIAQQGQFISQLTSEDTAIRNAARDKLIDLVLAKMNMENSLQMQEESIRIQLGGK